VADIDRPSLIDAAWDSVPSPDSAARAGRAPAQSLAAAEALLAGGQHEDAWETAEHARAGFAASDPLGESDALYLLARIAGERGFARVGEERVARAIALRGEHAEGTVPVAWHELRAALAAAIGDHGTATTSWESAALLARSIRDATGEGSDRLCIALRAVGDAHLARGDRARAREVFTSLVSEARGLAPASADPYAFRHITSALHRLGDACREDGDLAAAIGAYRDAVREAKRAAAASDAPEAMWDLSVGLNRLGSTQLEADQAQAAIASFEQSIDLRRAVCELAERSPEALSGLASSLAKLGAALLQDGDVAGSNAAFEEAAALDREAAIEDDHQTLTMVPPPIMS